jgi:hypothetical protein
MRVEEVNKLAVALIACEANPWYRCRWMRVLEMGWEQGMK